MGPTQEIATEHSEDPLGGSAMGNNSCSSSTKTALRIPALWTLKNSGRSSTPLTIHSTLWIGTANSHAPIFLRYTVPYDPWKAAEQDPQYSVFLRWLPLEGEKANTSLLKETQLHTPVSVIFSLADLKSREEYVSMKSCQLLRRSTDPNGQKWSACQASGERFCTGALVNAKHVLH